MPTNDARTQLSRVAEIIPAKDVTAFFRALAEAMKEEGRTRVEMEKVKAAREVAMEAINRKHDLYRMVFEKLFEGRRAAIAKHFEVIDKGIAANDQELILGGLKGLGQIVAASPFADLERLAAVLEGGEKLEI